MSTDIGATAYGVVIAALRDDEDAIGSLLDGLAVDELTALAAGSVLALAQALRTACAPQYIDQMIHTLQGLALADTTGGTP
ncbi:MULTISPECIES: hypothetical protein [Streptomyces]|uniref:Uncharacterized protein n=1 Tax=Streptomyces venezuelae (strain ATCC 10712 / CBS 650.69 / DSM 40230 / JCM 4526 / NBRC 13096 / PD 04745) TaxID=953739 RepID=F2RFW6_STRVP|nr:hypothetical protein [Streptomyces venezuelae]APE23002.1 hypothetical protein vnz_19680 [Streptomyces venezuelae]QES00383.1 hypothetical protein DEJ43_19955 [Streptomyces venezuelae ATCC 10712]CCA57268.1 hypothetical protein SVEN_3982 [Streptomyces venezuelae ATCC 10712]